MHINNTLNQNKNQTFKAGLTSKIRNDINNVNIKELEATFAKYGVICDFKNNKPIAGGIACAVNVCQEAYSRFGLPFHFLPPTINIFNTDELIDKKDSDCFGFCTWGKIPVLKNQPESDLGSIYINGKDKFNDIKYFDELSDKEFADKRLCTNHFLGRFLHEIFHNIHLNLLINKHGLDFCYDENGDGILKDKLMQKVSVKDQITAIMSIGRYASKSYLELFSEILAKIVTESLDSETLELKNNPMDNLKNIPASLSKFIKKELE